MALTTTTTVPAPVNAVLMRFLLETAKKNCPYFSGTLPGTLEKSKGSFTAKWRRVENLATGSASLAELTGAVAFPTRANEVQPTITDLTVAVAKFGKYIALTEEVDLLNVKGNSDTMALLETLGTNSGEELNNQIRDVTEAGTNIRFTSGTTNATIVDEVQGNDIGFVINQLERNSARKFTPMTTGDNDYATAPIRAAYIGICHPDVGADIQNIVTGPYQFIDVVKYAGQTQTYPGEFGATGGVRWVMTETASILIGAGTTSATGFRGTSDILNDVYKSVIYGKEAIGSLGFGEKYTKEIYEMGKKLPTVQLIQHKPGDAGAADPFNERASIAWKAWFAGKILNQAWLYEIRSLSKDL